MKIKKVYFLFLFLFPSIVFAGTNGLCQDYNVIRVFNFLYYIIYVIKVLIPVILIITGGYSLFKTIVYQEDLKSNLRNFITKEVIGVCIFFLPTFFSVIFSLVNDKEYMETTFLDCTQCMVSAEHCEYLLDTYPMVYDEAPNRDISQNIIVNGNQSSNQTSYMEIHFIVSGYYDDAILIRTKEKTILIDSGRKNGDKKVIPYLENLGVKTIDAIIGSHVHLDHVQAQATAVKKFDVKAAYYPVDINTCAAKHYCTKKDVLYIKDALKDKGIKPEVIKAGQTLEIGDMKLYFLTPLSITSSQNNNSFVFILVYGSNTFMFTGDLPGHIFDKAQFDENAKKLGISLNVDVFKYPHHGNSSVSLAAFKKIDPEYVIVPNYKFYTHPRTKYRNYIKEVGAKMYQQYDGGNILITSDKTNINIKTKVNAKDYKW